MLWNTGKNAASLTPLGYVSKLATQGVVFNHAPQITRYLTERAVKSIISNPHAVNALANVCHPIVSGFAMEQTTWVASTAGAVSFVAVPFLVGGVMAVRQEYQERGRLKEEHHIANQKYQEEVNASQIEVTMTLKENDEWVSIDY